MPATMADIARELGVSKMTVSRAINNQPVINAGTRARVLEVARSWSCAVRAANGKETD